MIKVFNWLPSERKKAVATIFVLAEDEKDYQTFLDKSIDYLIKVRNEIEQIENFDGESYEPNAA